MAGLSASELNQQDWHRANLIARQTEEATPTTTRAEEEAQENKAESVDGTAHEIQSTPNSLARQQIFRTLAAQHGNNYAARLGAAVMRQGSEAKPAANTPNTEAPDELDVLMGLTAHTTHYSDEQLKDARQLAVAETDAAKKIRLFKLLQQKTTYYIQWKNESKMLWRGSESITELGTGMCNVTSLAMALEGLGITLTQAKATFPDLFEEYKTAWLNDTNYSLEKRQLFVSQAKEATRFPDFLEQLRKVKKLGWLTEGDTWTALANLFNVKLNFITSHEGKHAKQWWLDNVQPAFERGESVVLGVQEHIIRLQEINEDGLVLDDPNGHTNLSQGIRRRNGAWLDFSWDKDRQGNLLSGNDTVIPWDVVENYNFRWVYKLSGPGATANSSAARPRPAAPTHANAPAPVAASTNPPPAQNSPHQLAPTNVTPAHASAQPVAPLAHGLLNPQDQQTAIAAMIRAMHAGMPKNRVVDQGYYAIRGEGKIDPTNKQAVNEWLFIRDHLFQNARVSVPIYLDQQ